MNYASELNFCLDTEPFSLSRAACGIKLSLALLGGGFTGLIGLPAAGFFGTVSLSDKDYNPHKESIKAESQRILERINDLNIFLESV